jgi:hypothetical protein
MATTAGQSFSIETWESEKIFCLYRFSFFVFIGNTSRTTTIGYCLSLDSIELSMETI